jgi:hypothetical protein
MARVAICFCDVTNMQVYFRGYSRGRCAPTAFSALFVGTNFHKPLIRCGAEPGEVLSRKGERSTLVDGTSHVLLEGGCELKLQE